MANEVDTIQKEWDDKDEPEVSDQRIRFNGIGDDGHETFMLSREYESWQDKCGRNESDKCSCFNFCKTAIKPYDQYVTAVLLLAKMYLGDEITLSSDGCVSDWQAGVELINSKMKWNIAFKSNPNAKDPEDVNTAILENLCEAN